jgi:hypothetical protein
MAVLRFSIVFLLDIKEKGSRNHKERQRRDSDSNSGSGKGRLSRSTKPVKEFWQSGSK